MGQRSRLVHEIRAKHESSNERSAHGHIFIQGITGTCWNEIAALREELRRSKEEQNAILKGLEGLAHVRYWTRN